MKPKNSQGSFILVWLLVLYFFYGAYKNQDNCGAAFRHDVKTLQDTGLHNVKLVPVQSTVSNLTKLTHAVKINNHTPRFGTEFTCYQIDCRIRGYMLQDNEVHLLLVDLKDSTKTIIGVIPDITCANVKTSKFIKSFVGTTQEFETFKLPNNRVKDGIYTLTGVCFFDNAVPIKMQLHPVMDIVKQR